MRASRSWMGTTGRVLPGTRPLARALRGAVRDGEGAALVVLVLLVRAVEGLEESLLLVVVVLVGLRLGRVGDGAIRHGVLLTAWCWRWPSSKLPKTRARSWRRAAPPQRWRSRPRQVRSWKRRR